MTPELNRIYQGDCLEIMKGWPDGCVDLIVTDPEYGIGYKSNAKQSWGGGRRKADSSFGKDSGPEFEAVIEMARLLKDGGAIYSFMAWDGLGAMARFMVSAKLSAPIRILWDKVTFGQGDLRYYGNRTEDILFSAKGDHVLRWEKREGNIWQVWKAEMWNQNGGHTGHPCEKPTSIIERAVRLSSDKGMVILDPYCGSGTTPAVCERLGRKWIGIELEPKYCAIAQARIDAERAQGKLFQ